MKKERKTTDGIKILHKRFYANRPGRIAQLDKAREDAEVARKLRLLRENAGLTQRQLASLVGTAPSVISRLEDADYDGHSMAMLRRVAAALNQRVELRFVPIRRRLQPA